MSVTAPPAVQGRPGTPSRGVPSTGELSLDELRCLARLRLALRGDGLRLVAQPIVDLTTGEVVGHELLVRLVGPHHTLIGPDYFLAAAECTGLIVDVDRWVLDRAIGLAATGHRVHVNLSALSIGEPGLVTEIESLLESRGADPARLTLEITETAATEDLPAARAFAERFAAIGGRLALDDFGTGFGGLIYVKHLPVEMLKIDIEFVHDVVSNPRSRCIVAAIAGLAEELGQVTVAEGVEDGPTYLALRKLGVHCGQGFHIARPAPISKLGPAA